jgi:predicted transcriptional regulator
MCSINTAISLDQSLFDQADALAQEMHLSRSRLFVLALEDFIHRHENRALQARLNGVCEGEPDPEEAVRLRGMRRYQREPAEGEW